MNLSGQVLLLMENVLKAWKIPYIDKGGFPPSKVGDLLPKGFAEAPKRDLLKPESTSAKHGGQYLSSYHLRVKSSGWSAHSREGETYFHLIGNYFNTSIDHRNLLKNQTNNKILRASFEVTCSGRC